MDKKLEITKAAILLALNARAPLTVGELVAEIKEQAYMSKFAYAMSRLQFDGVVFVADDDAVELY